MNMLKYGMVGGGKGAFIGEVHRKAMALDHRTELVAGCFSRDAGTNAESGAELGVSPDRVYADYNEMARAEGMREDGIDFVSIVTSNYCHADACRAFLNNGINVVCEKPLALTLPDAEELTALAEEKGLLLMITYTFAGYPMLRHAKKVVERGDLGNIFMVMGEFPQDYLCGDFDDSSLGKFPWRSEPRFSGRTNSLGDIGSHIQFTTQYLTGLEIDSVCAKLDNIGPFGKLDTNSSVMVRFTNGATGMFWSSQVALGNDNNFALRIYGEKGSIEWCNEAAEEFNLSLLGHPTMRIRKGHSYLGEDKFHNVTARLPFGHTEGLYAAFANLYLDYCEALENKLQGKPYEINFPTARDGLHGVRYIERCLESNESGQAWVKF